MGDNTDDLIDRWWGAPSGEPTKEGNMAYGDDDWDNYDDEFGPDRETSRRGRRPPDRGHSIPNVEAIRETDAALLVRGPGLSSDPFGVSDPNEEGWIPKSQILQTSEVKDKGDKGTLIISTWIAEKRGLV